jgi:hypothetical protein
VRAHIGNRFCGSRDLDAALMEHYTRKRGINIPNLRSKAYLRLVKQITRLREMLTIDTCATIDVEAHDSVERCAFMLVADSVSTDPKVQLQLRAGT